jgi:hypothetical protein
MSASKGLVEQFCVAVSVLDGLFLSFVWNLSPPQRDEEIGVYGFVFFRDMVSVTVIIDE